MTMNPKLVAADAALKQGDKSRAADLIIAALSEDPQCSRPAYPLLLNLLLELRRHGEGVTWSARAVALHPKDYGLLNLQGAFLRLVGRHQEALTCFDNAIRLRPGEIAAQINKGHCLNDMQNGVAAETLFTRLLRQQPKLGDIYRALAQALRHQGKLAAAQSRLRQAIALNRKDVDAWLDLSALGVERGDRDGAIEALNEAIVANPDVARLLQAKAVLLRHASRNQEAETFLTSLLPRFERAAWLHHEMARAVTSRDAALATSHHRRAVQLAPHHVDYRLALAEILFRTPGAAEGAHIDDAFAMLATCPPASRLQPFDAKVRTEILTRVADYEAAKAVGSFRDLGRLWASAMLHTALFDHLGRVESAEDRHELIAQHRLWGDKMLARAQANPILHPPPRQRSAKIRLGFLSSDLRDHPVAYFVWPLFEHADRERFEIYCYSFYRGENEDAAQRYLASRVDAFRWQPYITDRNAAQMIADDQLDILFELGGSTHMNKLEVMAWKPAKLCASWLGYPHSAGLTTIDHLLVDPALNPPDPKLLIERPLVMPRTWIAMSDKAFPDSHVIDPVAPVRRNGFVTFGTANNPYKYNAAMLNAWARTVARVPGSRFIFVRPEAGSAVFQRNIRARFQAEGVTADRIEFRAIRGGHMPHYNDIDITLDTFPQTGGTTTCEALWMGVPTVSLVGEALFERLSYSILVNAGLGDLCATTAEQFVDIAVALAADTDRIQALRTGLRDQIRGSPLGQTQQFARDFYDLVARTVAAEG
jgi:protein O-GlcNAc transferase